MSKILELARRSPRSGQASGLPEGPATAGFSLDALRRTGDGAKQCDGGGEGGPRATGSGLPEVWNEGIRSFYDLLRDPAGARHCRGTACRFPGGHGDGAAAVAEPAAEVCCLGRCYEAPTSTETKAAPIPRRALSGDPVVLRHLLGSDAAADPAREAIWSDYDLPDGAAILAAVDASGLRGRGGAAFASAAKWKVARDTPARDRVVVANGDEGDPGAYIDRLLLEEAPHSVLAGMLACARAIGARRGVVYVRAEYPLAAVRVRDAATEAAARGLLGDLQIRVVSGAGSYVAGEETALLRSIEGLRAEPAPKPPYPAQRGLHGLPTVVHNVETLSVVPWIARNRRGAGTKAVCVAGAVARPGVVEVDLGTSLRRVLHEGAGGPARGCTWKMALVGGPLGRVVAAEDFDVALSFEQLAGLGHAGVVVFDRTVSPRALAEHLFAFACSESCGNCTPCRIGVSQLASRATAAEMERLMETMDAGSLCGFGQGVSRPIRDLLRLFGNEVFGVAGARR